MSKTRKIVNLVAALLLAALAILVLVTDKPKPTAPHAVVRTPTPQEQACTDAINAYVVAAARVHSEEYIQAPPVVRLSMLQSANEAKLREQIRCK